ncbi:MCE family protein [Nocardioides sp.]|nr:MCE family protein [Nocardioides sp.]
MERFQDRNPVVVGAIALATMALLLVAGLRAGDLPLIGRGDTYYAEFAEAGGLKVNDPVHVVGVRVGKVTSIELDGAKVRVGFRFDTDLSFGTRSRAEIRVRTLLGAMSLDILPAGSKPMEDGGVIPLARTTAPFEIVEAFSQLAEKSKQIDADQLATSLTALADLTRNTPKEFRAALDGVSRLSTVMASRDKEVNRLLRNLGRVSHVLDARDEEIVTLMDDADTLFNALLLRKEVVHRILVATTALSKELTQLIRKSRVDLGPALEQLDYVMKVLMKNEDNLESTVRLLAPFTRVFASVTGNGPWLDGYIYNMPPVPGTP